MINEKMFVSKNKSKVVWGQIISNKDYVSKVGFVFMKPGGKKDNLKIDIYNEQGFVKTINCCGPNESFQLIFLDLTKIKK